MGKARRGSSPEGLAELRSWYLDSLRPKVVGAASAGAVTPAAAVALDRQLRELLELTRNAEATA